MDAFSTDLFSRDKSSRDAFSAGLLGRDKSSMSVFGRNNLDLFGAGEQVTSENKMMHKQSKKRLMIDESSSESCVQSATTKKTSYSIPGLIWGFFKKKDDNVNESKPQIEQSPATVETSPGSSDAATSSNALVAVDDRTKDTDVSSVTPQDRDEKDIRESSNTSQALHPKIKDNQAFLKKHRRELISKIKDVDEMTDLLENFSSEQRAKVAEKATSQAKMRLVFDYTNSKKAAEYLVKALLEHASDVMEDLIGV